MSDEKRSNILSEDLVKMIYKYTDFKPKSEMIVVVDRIFPIKEIYSIEICDYDRKNDGLKLCLQLRVQDIKKIDFIFKHKKDAIAYYNKKIDELKESGMIYGIDELYKKIE